MGHEPARDFANEDYLCTSTIETIALQYFVLWIPGMVTVLLFVLTLDGTIGMLPLLPLH